MKYSDLVNGKEYKVKNLHGKQVRAKWKAFSRQSGCWVISAENSDRGKPGFLYPFQVNVDDISELGDSDE